MRNVEISLSLNDVGNLCPSANLKRGKYSFNAICENSSSRENFQINSRTYIQVQQYWQVSLHPSQQFFSYVGVEPVQRKD